MDSYKKKYKEALERMKSWARGEHPECFTEAQKTAEFIFPELKENEDERIRKWLEEHIEAMPDNSIEFKDIKRIDVLHWLENQSEQKLNGTFVNVDDVREDFIDEIYRVLNADSTNDRANQIIDAFDSLPTVTIKQDPCKHCKMTYSTCYSFPCDEKKAFEQGKTALEAINEEKVDNADKVEPKIKIGDWVVKKDGGLFANGNHYVRITDIDKERYWFDSETWLETKYIRLWNISDAKDGDVLNSPSNRLIWIYKDNEHYHACVNMNYVTDNVAIDDLLSIPNDACPATKDEQTILFAKMKESGYEWDAKLKQLRKIENETEIPFGAKDSELQEATYYIPKGFHVEIDDDKMVIKKGENPTVWSEDDETMLKGIISDLKMLKDNDSGECGKLYYQKEIFWLKSLKNRYTWKPSKK